MTNRPRRGPASAAAAGTRSPLPLGRANGEWDPLPAPLRARPLGFPHGRVWVLGMRLFVGRRNRRCVSPRPLSGLHGENTHRLWPWGTVKSSSSQNCSVCSAVSIARSPGVGPGKDKGEVLSLSVPSPFPRQRGCSPGSFPPAAGDGDLQGPGAQTRVCSSLLPVALRDCREERFQP